ncbi:low molecular weight protein arginine phosphatase [Paenibacillus thermotolerans]|uniref:low molecular weight protein arginine phosphatase n=1 Tax=Paenibacillus thermotolerans TaxID=3027807 RepID=UPI0023675785|nr:MULTISPECIES: low molecular weight protein arginine phosphatase [unclassified Paenibacillus]
MQKHKRLLFVCTGNTCRSPMAESLFRKLAAESGLEAEAKSAGVAALNGTSMSKHSATVLKNKGIKDTHRFQSSELTKELVDWADLILTMTSHHKRHVLESYPGAVDKTFTLKEYADDSSDLDALHRERESLIADLQVKMALKQHITDAEKDKLFELEQRVPNMDIVDPIGGSLKTYEVVARELEAVLLGIIEKLKQ